MAYVPRASVAKVAARWARRLAGALPSVLMTATGPPQLPMVERTSLLRQVRQHLDAAGMSPDLALTGKWGVPLRQRARRCLASWSRTSRRPKPAGRGVCTMSGGMTKVAHVRTTSRTGTDTTWCSCREDREQQRSADGLNELFELLSQEG